MSYIVPFLVLLFAAPVATLRGMKSNSSSAVGGKVVTLGDSYSSGTGIHKRSWDYEGGDCCRDHKTIPGARYANAEGMKGINMACSGGQILDINQQFDALQAKYAEDAASDWEGSVILFTIGGNDIRSNKGESWPEILTSCILSFYGSCHKDQENQVGNFDEVQGALTKFYTRVAEGASKASIRVLGYPRLLQRSWHCIPVPGLDGDAADWADDMVDQVNVRLSRAVAEVKSRNPEVDIQFVDVSRDVTKGACTIGKNQIHSIVLSGFSLSPMTFHPHQRGYDGYYKAFGNSMGKKMAPMRMESSEPLELSEVESILFGWDEDSNGKLCIGEILVMGGDDASMEVSKRLRMLFAHADKDQDDALSVVEFQEFLALVGDVD